MARTASKDFAKFLKNYDRTARGAGSQKDPAVDRLSALDVREAFEEGRDDFGLSRSDAARAVLDYAEDVEGQTRMGGGTEKALAKLRRYLRDGGGGTDIAEVVIEEPTIGESVIPFEDRVEQSTYSPFIGSYFDFVGGDPSNPADYYEGDPTRGGTRQFFADAGVEDPSPAGVVPASEPSFMRGLKTGDALIGYLGDPEEDDEVIFGEPEEEEDKGFMTEVDRVSDLVSRGLSTVTRFFG